MGGQSPSTTGTDLVWSIGEPSLWMELAFLERQPCPEVNEMSLLPPASIQAGEPLWASDKPRARCCHHKVSKSL